MQAREEQRRHGAEGGDEAATQGAVARVLDAERQAEDAVAAVCREAEQRLEAAREEARRIGRRTDERILALRARFRERTEAVIQSLESDEDERIARVERLRDRPERVQAAVRRVALRLTGPEEHTSSAEEAP